MPVFANSRYQVDLKPTDAAPVNHRRCGCRPVPCDYGWAVAFGLGRPGHGIAAETRPEKEQGKTFSEQGMAGDTTRRSIPGKGMEKTMPTRSYACPTFFRASVIEAKHDFKNGYRGAGYNLGLHLFELHDDPLEDAEVAALGKMIEERESDRPLWDWLSEALPRCMALVPRRRHQTFLEGFEEAYFKDLR